MRGLEYKLDQNWKKWALRILAAASILFVCSKLNNTQAFDQFSGLYSQYDFNTLLCLIGIALLSSFLNWALETFKWQLGFKNIAETKYFQLFKYNLASFALSYATPARIGVYPILSVLFPEASKAKVWTTKIALDFTQQTTTWMFATISSLFLMPETYTYSLILAVFAPLGLALNLLLLFHKNLPKLVNRFCAKWFVIPEKREPLIQLKMFALSVLRYGVFSHLILFLFSSFDVAAYSWESYGLVVLYFWLSSFIPRFLMSDLIGRQSIAILLFPDHISSVVLVVFIQWIFNALLPVLFGLKIAKSLKLI